MRGEGRLSDVRFGRRGDQGPSLREARTAWEQANERGDAEAAIAAAEEAVRIAPGSWVEWFDAGLLFKALQRWEESAVHNERARALFTPEDAKKMDGSNPCAWNLGIAATALGQWDRARDAWRAYGIELGHGHGPIDENLGFVPVRINPEASIPHQVVPDLGHPYVVWTWRRSPAHAVIASVPRPDSGHRYRDKILHDGVPMGTRVLDGHEVPVFEELVRLEDSCIPTWQAQVHGATDDYGRLEEILGPRELGCDQWSGMRVLCQACSLGNPDVDHAHPPAPENAGLLGLAGDGDELRAALDEWLDGHRHITISDLELLW